MIISFDQSTQLFSLIPLFWQFPNKFRDVLLFFSFLSQTKDPHNFCTIYIHTNVDPLHMVKCRFSFKITFTRLCFLGSDCLKSTNMLFFTHSTAFTSEKFLEGL